MTKTHRGPLPGTEAGYTLIELLISLVLGLLLISAVIGVFLGGLQTFRTSESIARMQEDSRAILELIKRDLRHAGYAGCRRAMTPELPRQDGPLNPGFIRNTLNPTPVQPDPLAHEHSFVPVSGFSGTGSGWAPAAPVSALISDALDHSDLLIVSAIRGGIRVTAHPGGNPPGSANIQVAGNNGLFAPGDIVMVADCESAAIFEISSGNPAVSGTIPHNTGAGTPGNWTQALGRSFVGAEVFQIEMAAYYIRVDPDSGLPTLFRNQEPLAQNVERMRTLYGVDADNDQRIEAYVSADLVADWAQVVAVRVHLLLSTAAETGLVERAQVLNFAGEVFTAPDLRQYQVVTTTVGLRNRLP